MKILFSGGGTAGHVNPAVAIAQAMLKKSKNNEVAFVGRKNGGENQAILSGGYKLYTLSVRGFVRKVSPKNIKSAYLAIRSLSDANRIIKDFRPDVIVGTGGYVSWPILRRGIRLGIPTVLHESNIYPGLVTRRLGGKCDLVLLNSLESLKFLQYSQNTRAVGNPLRSGFFDTSRSQARKALGIKDDEFFIISFGGSLGSEKINSAVISLMRDYSSKNPKIKHLHSAGTRYFDELSQKHRELFEAKNGCTVKAYIDNMPAVMTAADLVISRSGAMTLTEIAGVGTSAILVPSPNVADDHQLKNAGAISENGGAVLLEEPRLQDELTETVRRLYENESERKELARNVRKFHDRNSSEKICREIEELVSRKQTPSAK